MKKNLNNINFESRVGIVEYDINSFCQAITESEGEFPQEKVKNSKIFKYMHHYLHEYPKKKKGDLEAHIAKTIVIEYEYISNAYLDDFVDKYSRKHKQYPRTTRRLHFFNHSLINKNDLLEYIRDETSLKASKFWDKYLGYIVIKPVSSAMFGATVLKVYPSYTGNKSIVPDPDKTRREFNGLRNQSVNIFGKSLFLPTVAFQEQDSAVGVCATNALWSMFYVTSELFKTRFPSPYKITQMSLLKGATEQNVLRARGYGLNIFQIYKNFEEHGLNWDGYREVDGIPKTNLLRLIYAYNRCGIPLLLGYGFPSKIKRDTFMERNDDFINDDFIIDTPTSTADKPEEIHSIDLEISEWDYHLTLVNGYRFGIERTNTRYLADRIDRIYAHDSLFGPYAKITFGCQEEPIPTSCIPPGLKDNYKAIGDDFKQLIKSRYVSTHFLSDSTINPHCFVNTVIIPLDPTIEVTYEQIECSAENFNGFFVALFAAANKDFFYENAQWDIFIIKGSDYKEESKPIFCNPVLGKILGANYPLHIWVARLRKSGSILFDIVFDSSDVGSGFCCLQLNFNNDDFKEIINSHLQSMRASIQTAHQLQKKDKPAKDVMLVIREKKYFVSKDLSSNHINFIDAATEDRESDFYGNIQAFKSNKVEHDN